MVENATHIRADAFFVHASNDGEAANTGKLDERRQLCFLCAHRGGQVTAHLKLIALAMLNM